MRGHQDGHRVDRGAGVVARAPPRSPGPRCREGTANSAIRGSGPEHRHARVLARLAQHLLVARRADPVEDHPGDPDRESSNVEKPVQQRGELWLWPRRRRPGSPARRAARRRARSTRPPGRHGVVDAAVEQAHHALDDGDVRADAARAGTAAPISSSPTSTRVQVAAGPPGGQRVIAGVDVVGADLERRDPVPGAAAARRSNPLPPWSFRCPRRARRSPPPESVTTRCPSGPCGPASIGCLTLVISVTRSAASSSAAARRGR